MVRHFARLVFMAVLAFAGTAEAKMLRFAGYDFIVKEGEGLGPGPNDWKTSQAFVDSSGYLHLRLSQKNGQWFAGEVRSVSRFGFGTYEIEFEGDIAGQDRNVVFGFFNYPTADVGPDATNEIDIEFARWGKSNYKPLNYTVWPVDKNLKAAHQTFSFPRDITLSRHRFAWSGKSVVYHSAALDENGDETRSMAWSFVPKRPKKQISQSPMAIYFNLWGFRGQPPSDGRPVEVIIRSFTFTPQQ